LQSILSENRYVHDAGDDQCAEISAISILFQVALKTGAPAESWRRKKPSEACLDAKIWQKKIQEKIPKQWEEADLAHTHTLVSMSSDAEKRKAVTLCLSLFYIT
jgi:hypothetical protein